jgi:hypothetical protein
MNLNEISKIIADCESEEPPFSSLGTPYIGENSAALKIIAMGTSAAPGLCDLLPGSSPKAAACIAYCLGRIGDNATLIKLEDTLLIYENKNPKGPYDYAFIGNAKEAIRLLKKNE